MNYNKIEKGSVIGWDCYYVIVSAIIKDGDLHLNCICDNANNIYSFTFKEIINTTVPNKWLILSAKKAVDIYSYGYSSIGLSENDLELFEKIDRKIPVDVIAEVLTGDHDNRFDHWHED